MGLGEKRYTIVLGHDRLDLEHKVNNYIPEGYEPVGGPFITQDDLGRLALAQALYKAI